ncbi:tRNA (5-methylaminomethyl-2-thiouridine)(34)-methyltransferase MnmD [Marinobacter sp. X15-166B]|uniref:tRNA (5-methylaminomethyl-2-thiouridine)(34)-methyltransferase MnmD n=1 Tax=Marinobacter sp. X15-166B TaxID=1897620 RepID=UPI000B0A1469|nr:tRNA (5-methylaminomethyl-2-thiouridine)(34)-methyltransferase MnmD [Marinobacter sp. X15-166B]
MQIQPPLPAPAIESARVRWRDGQPESEQFGDVYFSRNDGLEETRYVFLQHNQLEARFRRLQAGESFVVAESGFGTGLSFLAVWQLWRRCAPPAGAVLHFVSVERYPLTVEDLAKSHQLWPELSELAAALHEQYPPLTRGLHRRLLDDGQVRLSLFFGDAVEGWHTMRFTADAWFLDGFAPAVNPQLWVDEVVDAVARHSKPGTTLATFTAVGRVRRGLQAAGFSMRKPPGYGFKRNMLAGRFEPAEPPHDPPIPAAGQWRPLIGHGHWRGYRRLSAGKQPGTAR